MSENIELLGEIKYKGALFQYVLVLRDCGSITKFLVNKDDIIDTYEENSDQDWEVSAREEMRKIIREVRERSNKIERQYREIMDNVKNLGDEHQWAEWDRKWKSKVFKYLELVPTTRKYKIIYYELASESKEKFVFLKEMTRGHVGVKNSFYLTFNINVFDFFPVLVQEFKNLFRVIIPRGYH